MKVESVCWELQISVENIAGVILHRLMVGMWSVVKSRRPGSYHIREMGYLLYWIFMIAVAMSEIYSAKRASRHFF